MTNKLLNEQLVKFIIIGLPNMFISYLAFIAAYSNLFSGNAFYSQCISYSSGILWSFFWSKKWTFSSKSHKWVLLLPFFILQVALLLLSAYLLSMVKNNLDLDIYIIWVFVMTIITIINFVCTKFLVFRA